MGRGVGGSISHPRGETSRSFHSRELLVGPIGLFELGKCTLKREMCEQIL